MLKLENVRSELNNKNYLETNESEESLVCTINKFTLYEVTSFKKLDESE